MTRSSGTGFYLAMRLGDLATILELVHVGTSVQRSTIMENLRQSEIHPSTCVMAIFVEFNPDDEFEAVHLAVAEKEVRKSRDDTPFGSLAARILRTRDPQLPGTNVGVGLCLPADEVQSPPLVYASLGSAHVHRSAEFDATADVLGIDPAVRALARSCVFPVAYLADLSSRKHGRWRVTYRLSRTSSADNQDALTQLVGQSLSSQASELLDYCAAKGLAPLAAIDIDTLPAEVACQFGLEIGSHDSDRDLRADLFRALINEPQSAGRLQAWLKRCVISDDGAGWPEHLRLQARLVKGSARSQLLYTPYTGKVMFASSHEPRTKHYSMIEAGAYQPG